MDGKQLRNSILQWAIQGKLVPQDPNDEPASVLLERIREEKARLVKEKKIKRDKNESIIYRGEDNSYYEKFTATGEVKCIDDEIPFDLPIGWCFCRLYQMCELIADCPHSTAPDEGIGYPLIRTPNVGFVHLNLNGVHRVSESTYNKRNERAVPTANDLIFAREAPAGNIAVIHEGENVCLGQRTVLVRPVMPWVNSYYLAYYILSPSSQLNLVGKSTGTTVAHVNLSDFRPYIVALPPLLEQMRIVKRINDLLPYISHYTLSQKKVTSLNQSIYGLLKKSILQEAIQGKLVEQSPDDEPASVLLERIKREKERFIKEKKIKRDKQESIIYRDDDNKYYENLNGEIIDITDQIPYDLPQSWRWVRLRDIGNWGAGATPNRSNLDYYNNGTIPWIKTGELNNGIVTDSIEKVTPKALEECSLRIVNVGDVLIAMYGATIGKLAIAGIQLTTNQACCACTPFGGIYNWYLFYYLMANKETLLEMGAGGAQPNISREKIVQFLFALPPENEQHRIVSKIKKLIQTIS